MEYFLKWSTQDPETPMTAECHREQGPVQGAWPQVGVVLSAARGQRVGFRNSLSRWEVQLRSCGAWGWAGPRLESDGPDPKPFSLTTTLFWPWDHIVLYLHSLLPRALCYSGKWGCWQVIRPSAETSSRFWRQDMFPDHQI